MLRPALLASALAAALPASLARAESLTGEVDFTGTPPAPKKQHREADPVCAKKEMFDDSILVKNGKLANVWIHVVAGAPDLQAPPPMPGRWWSIRATARTTRASRRRSSARSSSPRTTTRRLHNVHAYQGTATMFNKRHAERVQSKPIEQTLDKDGVVKLKCDVHTWMRGYVGVNKNPYQAVTGDSGTFKIDLPPGNYTVEAWQEKFGVKSAQIQVVAGKPAKLVFSYDGTEKGS